MRFSKLLSTAALSCLSFCLGGCSLSSFRVAGNLVTDRRASLPMPDAGHTDTSRMHDLCVPAQVLKLPSSPARAETELRNFLASARQQDTHVTIAGARHSMGGQTLGQKGCYAVDTLGLDHVGDVFQRPGSDKRWVTVGAGARWKDIVPKLAKQGYAPKVMQSNSDFSIGGSLSVNCHGWQHNAEPVASTVDSIKIMLADGSVRRCSRHENRELFSAALGGYGLFGVILEATLEVLPDRFYKARTQFIKAADYAAVFDEMTQDSTDGMAYGRISTAPDSFLQEALVTVLEPVAEAGSRGFSLLPDSALLGLKRAVFRSAVGSDEGKNYRWQLEKKYGETGGAVLRRSVILSEPANLYGNRDPKASEILQEYFIPKHQLAGFLERMRQIHQQGDCPDLLNITVRNVRTDRTTVLHYAREEVFGLVMLFHQRIGSTEQEAQMTRYAQRMVDAALASGGTYYLPYRLHARQDQFERAYPMARQFFALKRRYDPQSLFQNQFYQRYSR